MRQFGDDPHADRELTTPETQHDERHRDGHHADRKGAERQCEVDVDTAVRQPDGRVCT